jgi:putative phosphoesterase
MIESVEYKIAIVSDTHGNWQETVHEIQQEPGITHLMFLGDHAKDGHAIANALGIPAYIVRGNCDDGQADPEEQIVSLGDWRIMICHGHRYQVKQTLQNIYYRGLERGVDYILYGHTHIAVYEPGEVNIINPGSMSTGNMLMQNASWGILTLPAEKNENFFGKYEKKTCQTKDNVLI